MDWIVAKQNGTIITIGGCPVNLWILSSAQFSQSIPGPISKAGMWHVVDMRGRGYELWLREGAGGLGGGWGGMGGGRGG